MLIARTPVHNLQTCRRQKSHKAALALYGVSQAFVSRAAMLSTKLRWFTGGGVVFSALFLFDVLPATLKPSSAGVWSADLGAAVPFAGGKADAAGFLFFFDFFFLLGAEEELGPSPSSKAKLLANVAIWTKDFELYAVTLSKLALTTDTILRIWYQ